MLLKSIKIKNFRQFIDHNELSFSGSDEKNVTIVLGENGSGKTSLAQAFTWCLYGITDFKDSSMLNKGIENRMLPEKEEEVKVDIELIHDNSHYQISRVQKYRKKMDGKISIRPSIFYVAKKIKGQQEFLPNPELEMKRILPKELAGYFFLNGEHIEKLNKELSKGKSKEFATAVENLLGLKAFLEAIDHFKPSKSISVIGKYNAQYNESKDREIRELSEDIQKITEDIEKLENRIDGKDDEIALGTDLCKDIETIIRENAKSTQYQLKCDKLNRDIINADKRIVKDIELLIKNFNGGGVAFLSRSLIKDAREFLEGEDISEKGVPEVHKRTIDFLIDRGNCICGTELTKNSSGYVHLMELLDYIPPKSVGIIVNEFLTKGDEKIKGSNNYFDIFESQFASIRYLKDQREQYQSELEELSKLLEGMVDVGPHQKRLANERKKVGEYVKAKERFLKELGRHEKTLEEKNRSLQDHALNSAKNRKTEIYKSYSRMIFEKLTMYYEQEETKVRGLLQDAINKIFKMIYKGGMSISIDEKYRIRVFVDEVEGYIAEIETSTAQSTSVIFAFIAGIIQLAKDFSNKKDKHDLLASSEPYPLVMDAPLSNFDKRRIKSVCDTLPKVAEQVIIFIKDTDGEIAEEHMGDIIGKRYELIRKNEIETYIKAR